MSLSIEEGNRETCMQNMPEAAHYHNIKEFKQYQVSAVEPQLKWTEKSNTDFMTSFTEESSAKQYQ